MVADDRYIAEDAAALVAVDYEPLPFVADVRKAANGRRRSAASSSTNVITTYKVEFGDIDAAFAKAAHVFKQDLWQHRGAAHSIEARGIARRTARRRRRHHRACLDPEGARPVSRR